MVTMTIQQIAYNLDGKRFIEGKISRDREEAQKENRVLEMWIFGNYGLDDFDLRQAETELLF